MITEREVWTTLQSLSEENCETCQLGREQDGCASDFQSKQLKTACFQGFQDCFILSFGTVLL